MSNPQLQVGAYTATLEKEESTPWGLCATWLITRNGVLVGKMFQGPGVGYGDCARCSMSELVWAGKLPDDCASPKSPHYGIHFDTGPQADVGAALKAFADRADRLIAWREGRTS